MIYNNINQYIADTNKVLREESGLSYFGRSFIVKIVGFYAQAHDITLHTAYGVTVEYLRLHFSNPDLEEEDLFQLYLNLVIYKEKVLITKNPWGVW